MCALPCGCGRHPNCLCISAGREADGSQLEHRSSGIRWGAGFTAGRAAGVGNSGFLCIGCCGTGSMSRALCCHASDIDRPAGLLAWKPGCSKDCAVWRSASWAHGERSELLEARKRCCHLRLFARRILCDGCCNGQAACAAPKLAECCRLRDDASRYLQRPRAGTNSSGEERLAVWQLHELLRWVLTLATLLCPDASAGPYE